MRQNDTKDQSLLIKDAGHVSLLSHDIRSTYAELQSGLNALSQSPDIPDDHHIELQRLTHTAAHLGRLLGDVSEAIFQDHQPLRRHHFTSDPQSAIAGLVQRWQRIAERLDTDLTLTGCAELPEHGNLDMLALERVLSNLVSNAMRHGGPGPITIDIRRTGQPPNDALLFCIRDTGPGFPTAILNRTHTAPVPIGAGEPGSGLGLRVAFDAARRLEGTLRLQNLPEGGAEACLYLPLAPILAPRDLSQSAPSAFALPKLPVPLTALLVEDSDSQRLELRHDLEALGFHVIEARDGVEALDALTKHTQRIDIVYLDIELPLFSGWDVLAALKHTSTPPPPIIAVTSHVFDRHIQAILMGGACGVLHKPLTSKPELLMATVTALGDQLPQGWLTDQLDTKAPREDVYQRNLQALVKKLPPAAAQDVLQHLSRDLDRYLDQAEACLSAPSASETRATLPRLAHSLAGLFGTAGETEAQQSALNLSQGHGKMADAEIIAVLRQLRQNAMNIQRTILTLIHYR